MSNIGRLVRTTNEDCKECDGKMQLRAFNEVILIKGEEIKEERFHLFCNRCEYEEEYKKQNKNKHREIKEVKNDNKERSRPEKSFKRNFNRGNR